MLTVTKTRLTSISLISNCCLSASQEGDLLTTELSPWSEQAQVPVKEEEERGFGDSYFDEKKENKDKGETAYGADEEMLVVVFWEVRNHPVSLICFFFSL